MKTRSVSSTKGAGESRYFFLRMKIVYILFEILREIKRDDI